MGEIRTYPQRQRDKIKAGMVINKLLAHVKGEIEMTSTQVQAARILLSKILPDLKVIAVSEHSLIPEVSESQRLTDDQLMYLASRARPLLEGHAEVVEEPLKLVADQ